MGPGQVSFPGYLDGTDPYSFGRKLIFFIEPCYWAKWDLDERNIPSLFSGD